MALALVLGVAGALTWSSLRESRRTRNEMEASNSLRILAAAEAEYRAKDRDGNGVPDFWTADVTGLYAAGLIDRALAEADSEPLVPLVPRPVPYKGYYFRALVADNSDRFAGPYRQETDRKSGKVHHLTKFGFIAFPAEPGVTGKYMWIVNENNSTPRHDMSIPVPRDWPSDEEHRRWAKVQ